MNNGTQLKLFAVVHIPGRESSYPQDWDSESPQLQNKPGFSLDPDTLQEK